MVEQKVNTEAEFKINEKEGFYDLSITQNNQIIFEVEIIKPGEDNTDSLYIATILNVFDNKPVNIFLVRKIVREILQLAEREKVEKVTFNVVNEKLKLFIKSLGGKFIERETLGVLLIEDLRKIL